jgi:hypothetical protein
MLVDFPCAMVVNPDETGNWVDVVPATDPKAEIPIPVK